MKEEKFELKGLEKKVYRDLMQDGLIEIFLGLMLVLLSIIYTRIYTLGFIVIAMYIFPKLIEKIRSKYTYRRIGFVKLKDAEFSARGMLLYIFGFLALFIIASPLIFDEPSIGIYRLMPLYISLMLFGAFTFLSGQAGTNVPYLYFVLSFLLAIVFGVWEFNGYKMAPLIYYLLSIGVLFIIIGTIKFLYFLHENPKITDNEG